jgi:tRNA 2-thiouridine synthesizing protein A
LQRNEETSDYHDEAVFPRHDRKAKISFSRAFERAPIEVDQGRPMTEMLLDVRGLSCPLPVLRAKKTLKTLVDGDVLTVLATDPSSVRDFQLFCQQTGHVLEDWQEDAEGVFRYRIRNRIGE